MRANEGFPSRGRTHIVKNQLRVLILEPFWYEVVAGDTQQLKNTRNDYAKS